MVNMAAQVLIKKGKRAAATYVLSECKKCGQCQQPTLLIELLEILLDPTKDIDDFDTREWCRYLMAGGMTPDEFSSTGKTLDFFC